MSIKKKKKQLIPLLRPPSVTFPLKELVGITPRRPPARPVSHGGCGNLPGPRSGAAQVVHLPVPHEAQARRNAAHIIKVAVLCNQRASSPSTGHMTVPPPSPPKCASPTATPDNEAVEGSPPPSLNAIHACSQCTCPTLRRAAPHHDPPGLFLFSGLFLLQKQRQVVEGWSPARMPAFGKLCFEFCMKREAHLFIERGLFIIKKKMSAQV